MGSFSTVINVMNKELDGRYAKMSASTTPTFWTTRAAT